MRKFIILFISISCFIFTTFATAAVTTINLNSVPNALECDTECLCDETWVVSKVVLSVTSTISGDGCASNDCEWEHGLNLMGPVFDNGILLNPGRLIADLDDIDDPITRVRVELEDYCPPPTGSPAVGCTAAAVYNGNTLVEAKTSAQEGPVNGPGWFEFDTTNKGVDRLIVVSCNGHVGEIRITTTTTGPSPTSGTCPPACTYSTCSGFGCGGNTIYTCGGFGCGGNTYSTCGYSCGTYSTCGGFGCGGTYSTCGGFGCGGTYSTCGGFGCGGTYSTCGGFGCGTTYSTCGGFGCGTTYSTCGGFGCGGTYSTCGGFGCGTTYSTCGGFGCGTTYSTCGGFGCGTTYSTCGGFGCGTTYSTCGGFGCGTTYSTCGGYGCGTTFSTCGGYGCGTTYSTCGFACGSTISTCGLGCGYTSAWCQYPYAGYSRYRASSETPGPSPAF